MEHASDCAVNNGPALPPGPCDCGGALPAPVAKADRIVELEKALRHIIGMAGNPNAAVGCCLIINRAKTALGEKI